MRLKFWPGGMDAPKTDKKPKKVLKRKAIRERWWILVDRTGRPFIGMSPGVADKSVSMCSKSQIKALKDEYEWNMDSSEREEYCPLRVEPILVRWEKGE